MITIAEAEGGATVGVLRVRSLMAGPQSKPTDRKERSFQ